MLDEEKNFLINTIELLTKINNEIDFKEILDYFNEIDHDYLDMNDLEMFIEYIRIKLNNDK